MAKKGIECGDGWISRDKTCRKNQTPEQNQLLNKVSELINSLGEEIFEQNVGKFQTKEGAIGMQHYFSVKREDGDVGYHEINRVLYDDQYRQTAPEKEVLLAEAARMGFEEMATYPVEEIQAHYAEKGVEYDGKSVYRGMAFSDLNQINDYVSSHQEGDLITYKSFTSTTVESPQSGGKLNGGWGVRPVQIKITQADNSRAKWADPYKRSKDEGELLFPPDSQFKVKKVVIDREERLPDRLREPVLDLFKSSKDGFGTKNLKLSAIMGGLDPSEVLTRPEYEWLRAFFKKRGFPKELGPDTTLGDICSVSNMRGGKIALYRNLINSLKLQVGAKERTGQYDVLNAYIELQEIV
jgi:hypothetical protein